MAHPPQRPHNINRHLSLSHPPLRLSSLLQNPQRYLPHARNRSSVPSACQRSLAHPPSQCRRMETTRCARSSTKICTYLQQPWQSRATILYTSEVKREGINVDNRRVRYLAYEHARNVRTRNECSCSSVSVCCAKWSWSFLMFSSAYHHRNTWLRSRCYDGCPQRSCTSWQSPCDRGSQT